MQISIEGLSLIKKFEGMELEAYKCAAGVWTIGYGHIKDVKEGDVLNEKNVRSVRPAFGLHPKEFSNVLGKTFKGDFEKGTPLSWGLIN